VADTHRLCFNTVVAGLCRALGASIYSIALRVDICADKKIYNLAQVANPHKLYSNTCASKVWEIYTPKITSQKLYYLHNNPVTGGIVDEPEDYNYSSARNYCGKSGLIDVNILE